MCSPACWRGATCSSRTCRDWARRPWPRPSPSRWAASSPGVQCTPDLLPGDLTGFRVFDQHTREFEFLPGPVFADVLLADEINRATPRTQSALLEAMAERQVTVDNVRHVLSDTFFVIATQNPVEQHGTYPLPEAQLDRFAMKLRIGYPGRDHELAMLEAAVGPGINSDQSVSGVMKPGELRGAAGSRCPGGRRRGGPRVSGRPRPRHASASSGHPWPQPTRAFDLAARWRRARAFLVGRSYVTPDDVQDIAEPVLAVRLGIEPELAARVHVEITAAVPVPVYARAGSSLSQPEGRNQ